MNSLQPGKIPAGLLMRLLQGGAPMDERVLIGPGIGRDSAAIQFGDSVLVVKTDPITFPTERPATHLLHVNANDIACQGATPSWLLVTALLPAGDTTEESVSRLFNELQSEAARIGVTIIGGHTEITDGIDRLLLIGTMIGETTRERLIDPRFAQSGDRLLLTKSVGIEGTALLAGALRPQLLDAGLTDGQIQAAGSMLDDPGLTVVPEATALVRAGCVTSLHDPTEGGIASAVREMAIAADCGVVISHDAIPVAEPTRQLGAALGFDPLGLLASGSLIAAVPKDSMPAAEAALAAIDVPFTWIGKLTPKATGFRMRRGTEDLELPEFAVDEVARLLTG